MKVKRYFATSMRNALEMIRQEQGPDATILSNRKVDGGFELLTAEGDVDEEVLRRFTPQPEQRSVPDAERPTNPHGTEAHYADGQLWTHHEIIENMQHELQNIKSLLESQLSGLAWTEFGVRHPHKARLLRLLARSGIDPRLARQLTDQIDDDTSFENARRALLARLVESVVRAREDVMHDGGRIVLWGATGVGKTTVASKIAAHYALAHGADNVALISIDDQRLGAHEQLKLFGRLASIPVFALRSEDELTDVLAQLDNRALVIIDTPGFAGRDANVQRLNEASQAAGFDDYLVMAATTDYLSLARNAIKAPHFSPHACVLTKLDEAASLGPAVSVAIEASLPLAYCCAGPRIPDDIAPANARDLVRQLWGSATTSPATTEAEAIEQAFSVSA